MKVFFLGRYNQSEILSGPEKVAKRIFAEFTKENKSVFIEYFFDGRQFGYFKKLFGNEKIKNEVNEYIARLGIFTLFFYLLKERPSIIHIINYERFTLIAFIYKFISKVKIIYNVHGISYHENINYKKVSSYYILKDRICEIIMFRYSDKIIFLSDESVDIASKYFKFEKNKIKIFANGVDDIFYLHGKNKILGNYRPLKIIFVGDIKRREKGFKFLSEALKQIKFSYEIYFVCNNEEFSVNNFISVPKLDSNNFAGFLDDKVVYISSSEYEPFSISAVEAMAAGLVTIVTKQTGMSRFIAQDENGYVINFGDEKKLVEILNLLNENNNMLARISENAKLIYDSLNWEKIFIEYKNFYKI